MQLRRLCPSVAQLHAEIGIILLSAGMSTLDRFERNISTVVDPVPAVLPAEVTKTIRHININKAPGSDDLNIELIKAINDDSKMMAQLTHLCNQIITEGK